ncbi:hypothetical protein AB0M36_36895 [Actinoplanes sp. NPDC051346]|uniref:hypothetical protein n=1 Tax=Actinoplanes sp. NPDC051346 TaxID=3155048 RepID=UPI003435BC52
MSEYSSYDIKQLLAMVTAGKQTLGQSHEQIQAWTRAQQMLDRHWTALQGFRQQLAAKWPPEQNAASAAYLLELDRLLNAVTQTAEAASSNAVQIGYVTEAITQAHTTLETLHREYVDNEAKIADYNAKVDAVGTGVSAVQGPIAGFIAKDATELFTSPPVDDGRQDQLQQQARQAMDTLSGAAHDASVNMTTPPDYIPPRVEKDGDTHLGSDSTGGGAQRPPTIDPPAHTRAHLTVPGHVETGGGDGGSATGTGSHPAAGVVGGPSGGASQPPSRVTGPELSGVIAPPPVPPTPLPPPVTGPTTLPSPTPLPAIPATPGITPLPGNISGARAPLGTTAGGAARTGIGGSTGGAGVRALPPGGRIDGVTGLPQQRAGQLGGSRTGVQRVNPVGGVIGTQGGNPVGGGTGAQRANAAGGAIGAQRGPGGASGPAPANSGVTGMTHGRRAGRSETDQGRHWDPDNPWAVAEGVAPVIEPDPADTVDPGPGIIGLHR